MRRIHKPYSTPIRHKTYKITAHIECPPSFEKLIVNGFSIGECIEQQLPKTKKLDVNDIHEDRYQKPIFFIKYFL